MFTIPTDLAALSDEDLAQALAEAREEGRSYTPDGDYSDEDISRIEELSMFVANAVSEQGARAQAAEERTTRVATALSAFEEPEAPAEDTGEEFTEQPPTVEQPPAPAPAPRQEHTAQPKVTRRAAKVTPPTPIPDVTPKRRTAITAAADLRGFTAGQEFGSLADAARPVLEALHALPKGNPSGIYSKKQALTVRSERDFHLNDFASVTDAFTALSSEAMSRSAQGLTAGAGWGAPSEQRLDFCSVESTDGLLVLPEIGMSLSRGGYQYTKGPSFADVLGSATGFIDMTEAQAEADTPKTVLTPEVPGFTEVRLEAVGVIIEADILLRAGWPELIRRYVELALIAHEYKKAAKFLAKIRAIVGAAVSVPNGFGNALDVLHVLEVVIKGERQRQALPDSVLMEGIAPDWLRSVIRADLANRNGVDLWNVSDAQIDAAIRARGADFQYVRAVQPLDTTAGVATAYPTTADIILYPPGTFVAGVEDVLTLSTVYDSTNLKKNKYIELFTEEGVLVANPCGDGKRVSVPLTINGRTASASIAGNLFVAP